MPVTSLSWGPKPRPRRSATNGRPTDPTAENMRSGGSSCHFRVDSVSASPAKARNIKGVGGGRRAGLLAHGLLFNDVVLMLPSRARTFHPIVALIVIGLSASAAADTSGRAESNGKQRGTHNGYPILARRPFVHVNGAPSIAAAKMAKGIPEQKFQRRLSKLQSALRRLQFIYRARGYRGIVILEGVDAGGKGGVIKKLVRDWDHGSFSVHPTGAPTDREKREHFLSRFERKLPPPGKIVIFDRSHYGRVLVERVEQLTKPEDWQNGYGDINAFERDLSDHGVRIAKVFLYIDQREQANRFLARAKDRDKRWKLTPEDIRNRKNWHRNVEAAEEMFARTHTDWAPWKLIATNSKQRAQVTALKDIYQRLSAAVDFSTPPLDPEVAPYIEALRAERNGSTKRHKAKN